MVYIMNGDSIYYRSGSEGAPPVRVIRFSHARQGQDERALDQRKEALRAPSQTGPRATLTRRGRGRHPAPDGDAVAGGGKRQATLSVTGPAVVGAGSVGTARAAPSGTYLLLTPLSACAASAPPQTFPAGSLSGPARAHR